MHITQALKRHRFPASIISHAVWLYHHFNSSYQDVQEQMAYRGIILSHETVRFWCNKFAVYFQDVIRKRERKPTDKCYIDEVLGRKKFIHRDKIHPYVPLTLNDIKSNLTSFLKIKLHQYNMTEYILEKNCRSGSSTSTHFINTANNRMLSTKVIVKLADYFQISIDEMIGRINI